MPLRVLVMDDEASVARVIQRLLQRFGHEPTITVDGAECVRAYREHYEQGKRFDVVIMDLTVSNGMGGVEALAQLKEIDAEVKAVASSGYSDNPVMSHPKEHGFSGVLAKPYELAEMRAMLARVTEGS
ncbi:MAG: response regulator [Candidatus Synoicihabitans palmerolidicus]|nr:response regulator [Candidatus Synoicihabitans palmerolidicus]